MSAKEKKEKKTNKQTKKKKQYSHCRSGVAWQSVPRHVSRFESVIDVSWGVYWFLDYRPRARKDLRDETHDPSLHTLSPLIFLLSRFATFLVLLTRLIARNKQIKREDVLPCGY